MMVGFMRSPSGAIRGHRVRKILLGQTILRGVDRLQTDLAQARRGCRAAGSRGHGNGDAIRLQKSADGQHQSTDATPACATNLAFPNSFALMRADPRLAVPDAKTRAHEFVIAALEFQNPEAVGKTGVRRAGLLRRWRRRFLTGGGDDNQANHHKDGHDNQHTDKRLTVLKRDLVHDIPLYVKNAFFPGLQLRAWTYQRPSLTKRHEEALCVLPWSKWHRHVQSMGGTRGSIAFAQSRH
jgi:hypothetical protein